MKLLILAYYYPPYHSVGSQRPAYWARNLKTLLPDATVHVITAIPFNQPDDQVDKHIHVAPTGKPLLSIAIKDPGLNWKSDIVQYLKSHPENYTHVILTGGPFMHFGIAGKLKRMFACKVIFDYRDPFSNNPRFGNQGIKSKVKAFFERRFNRKADLIITVNELCSKMLAGYQDFPEKFRIIPNGYDESAFEGSPIPLRSPGRLNLVYAGTVYGNASPKKLIDVLESQKDTLLHHLGNDSEEMNGKKVIKYGMLPYEEMAGLLKSAQIGLILTSGDPFESTTKVYDYIGAGLPVWIITGGQLYTGGIAEATKGHTVFWSLNNVTSISETLKDITSVFEAGNLKAAEGDVTHSRRAGLEKLIRILGT